MNSFLQNILSSNHQVFLLFTQERENIFHELKHDLSGTENLFLNLKVLDIQKGRELIKFGNIKFNETHFMVISFYSATLEAQNSLLKFLEDTPVNLKIIFLVSEGANLLETFLSRVFILDLKQKNIEENTEKNIEEKIELKIDNLTVTKFLKTKKTERMKLKEIIDILEKEDEYAKEFDKKERKDREATEIFLLELEKKLYLMLEKDLKNKRLIKDILNIQDFKKYIKLSSSSPKIILEYLSLSIEEF